MRRQLLAYLLLLPTFAFANPSDMPPANLEELLEQVQQDKTMAQAQHQQREARFIAENTEQAALLAAAKAELAEQEALTQQLTTLFEQQERQIAQQQAELTERSGTLGELFGTVRQVARESASVISTSLTSAQYPDRASQLTEIAEQKNQPTIEAIRAVWLLLQQEMTVAAKVDTFNLPVITPAGNVATQAVTRVGPFSAVSEGQFLRYLPENGNTIILSRQPVHRLQQVAMDYTQASEEVMMPMVIDPSRGAILTLLGQKPNWQERLAQGGGVGYIILLVGVIGLIIALQRFIVLVTSQRAITKQRAQQNIDMKNPLGRILSVYRQDKAHDTETLGLQLDEAILREVPMIERGLTILALLAAVAPMLGLLGTVSGMIETFQAITLFGTGDPKLMSGGISQALVTTELGLAVAIPLLILHSILSSKSNQLVQILDEESAAMIARYAEQDDANR